MHIGKIRYLAKPLADTGNYLSTFVPRRSSLTLPVIPILKDSPNLRECSLSLYRGSWAQDFVSFNLEYNSSSIMDRLTEVQGHSDQLAAAVKSLGDNRREADSSDQLGTGADADVDKDRTLFNRAKSSILASIAAIKVSGW